MILTERDQDIIGFVLNMKFATVSDIHQKFFRQKKDGSISTSEWYTRERLRELIEHGYLNSVRYRFESKCYYIGTKHGYDLCRFGIHHSDAATPIHQIDIRTFDHDQKVMRCRLLLEEQEKTSNWISDRQLKRMWFDYFTRRSSRDAAPDGVYTSVAGKTIAFEYEIAQKSKQRYRDKMSKYYECLSKSQFDDRPTYDHVVIVCEKESVRNILLDTSSWWKEHCTIVMADEFFARSKMPVVTISPADSNFDLMQ